MPLARIEDLNGPPDEVAQHIEQAKRLSDLYDEFIAFDQDDVHERPPGIHASELYPCLRKAVYSCMDTPKVNNVAKFWKQRFKVGTAIHLMMQADFHKMAKQDVKGQAKTFATQVAAVMGCSMSFDDEVPISPEHQKLAKFYKMYSHADGVFTFSSLLTGEIMLRIGLEIKTESPDEFAKLKAPKPVHVRQAHIYMANLDLPLMWFFYMNKGNQNNTNSSAPYLMVWQPDIWVEVEARCTQVLTLAAQKKLPPREESILCEFCPWSHTCQPSSVQNNYSHRPSRKDTIRGSGQ